MQRATGHSGDWRACIDTLPKGCTVMGTVSVGMNTGALVHLTDSGNLVMVAAGTISMLNQRQIRMLFEVAERAGSSADDRFRPQARSEAARRRNQGSVRGNSERVG
jgi:hypothetical protein